MADNSVRRLIALLGHLTPGSRIAISELAHLVGAEEATLADDLMTLSLCGVAPFYPDDCMPLIVEDGYVEVWGELPALSGTVRLSSTEAAALASALQAAGFTAEDPLTRKLLEAAAAKSFDAESVEQTIRTLASGHAHKVYQQLAESLAHHAVVRITYAKAGSDGESVRDVEPAGLFAERSAWYLTAWCRSVGGWRTFRVDRIRAAEPTGETFEPRHDARPGRRAFAAEGLPVATLRFSPDEAFDEREWPSATVLRSEPDGSTMVAVPFGGTAWVARHVMARLGAVEVIEPAGLRTDVADLAAAERVSYDD